MNGIPPDRFRADLKKLPVTAFLRARAGTWGRCSRVAMQARITEAVFSGRRTSRGPSRIFERVHFLGHDVGIGADAARRQPFFFGNRRATFAIEAAALKIY